MFGGLFVGMVTWDVVYRAQRCPAKNEKMMAEELFLAAGGPACNAAVAFSALGDRAVLEGSLGIHPMATAIRRDLESFGVRLVDLTPKRAAPPPISSIIVDNKTGERAVLSVPAAGADETAGRAAFTGERPDVILADGHQIAAAIEAKERAPDALLVVDGGSWKDGLERLLPLADIALCSADFFPPGCDDPGDTLSYLCRCGVPFSVITNGPEPMRYANVEGDGGILKVPQVNAIDTMGAGDIFHGAFCSFALRQDNLSALASAAEVAALSCSFFGTRAWIDHYGS